MKISNEHALTFEEINKIAPGRIRTFTGIYLDPKDPKPEEIDIKDIAMGLAYTYRFGGMWAARGLTVAEHSLDVLNTVRLNCPGDQRLWLTALLHDATEAYLCDIPSPVKRNLPDYREMENRLYEAIRKKFGLLPQGVSQIKHADELALNYEWKRGLSSQNLRTEIEPMTPGTAYFCFMHQYQFIKSLES